MWKSLSIVAAILTAGAAFFSYKNVQQFKNEQVLLAIAKENQTKAEKHLAEVKQSLTTDTEGRKKTESERDQIVIETEGLKPKIDSVIKDIESRQADLETVTARWTEVKKQVDDAGGIEQLKQQLTSLSDQKSSLDSEVAGLKAQTTAATGQFESLNQVIADLRRKETWQARGIIQDGFRASIVQVDRAFGFITLNAGNSRGVVSGATLDIKRGGSVVGQAKVTNVEQRYAVADLVGVNAAEVQVGDSVTVAPTSSEKNWRPSASPTAPAAPGAPADGTTAEPATPAAPAATPTAPADPFAEDPASTTPTDPTAPATPAAPVDPATPAPPAETPADPFGN